MQPKTIKIFLLQGDPTGAKIVQMMNWTGKALIIPRNQISNILERKELSSQCVYLLIGESDEGNTSVYVGEAESFKERIPNHIANKDFWNIAIPFISKDENLTKAHVKYLESVFAEKLTSAGRVKLENGNLPNRPKLPEEDTADMLEFAQNVQLLLATLGYNFFVPVIAKSESESEDLFYIDVKFIHAKGLYTNEGFVVLKDSFITCNPLPSEGKLVTLLRDREAESGNIIKETNSNGNEYYRVLNNILAPTPSAAAVLVYGYPVNGWEKWKDKDGRTLNEVKR
jgi:hypothetical protein